MTTTKSTVEFTYNGKTYRVGEIATAPDGTVEVACHRLTTKRRPRKDGEGLWLPLTFVAQLAGITL